MDGFDLGVVSNGLRLDLKELPFQSRQLFHPLSEK